MGAGDVELAEGAKNHLQLGLQTEMSLHNPIRALNLAQKITAAVATAAAALAFLFPMGFASGAGVDGDEIDPAAFPACRHISQLPEAYGEVVFRHNQTSPNHLYIIGVGHRDSVTRRNGNKTARIQAEVYKIAEWLVLNEEVALLVPEGFFEKNPGKACRYGPRQKTRSGATESLKSLEECFADDSNRINAAKLLLQNYGLRARQVEDRRLYDEALRCLIALDKTGSSGTLSLESELDRLQQKRTVCMLEKIPVVVAEEFLQGNIPTKEAIFTVGLNHVAEIIRYLKAEETELHPSALTSLAGGKYSIGVNGLSEAFGITIIVPRTLAEDHEVLKITRLNTIMAAGKATSSQP